jgi:uncharacterized protein (TIGR00106 family)
MCRFALYIPGTAGALLNGSDNLKLKGEMSMLAEISIIPVGGHEHSSAEIAKVLKLVEQSGLPYQFTPSATCIEGGWDEIMELVRRCHERARKTAPHLVTLIKIEDDEGERNKLGRNVESVEEKIGHSLKTEPNKSA